MQESEQGFQGLADTVQPPFSQQAYRDVDQVATPVSEVSNSHEGDGYLQGIVEDSQIKTATTEVMAQLTKILHKILFH